jgi:indolepyruvate ferredoxin oxidoreductase beta subunit
VKIFNMVLAGVGGQGILLAAEILGTAAVKEGFDVRVSEVHGMAQRGGAVVSMVRIGEKVFSPLILEGEADVILGFEPIETLRNAKYASEKTVIMVGDERIPPPVLTLKGESYPKMDVILERLKVFSEKIVTIEASKLAYEAGSPMVQNVVMLGALAAAGKTPIKKENFMEALRELLPAKYLNVNVKAFELGYQYIKSLSINF